MSFKERAQIWLFHKNIKPSPNLSRDVEEGGGGFNVNISFPYL